ncbi:MAG TPA: hypothetical protein ENF75_07130 [Acidilobales archaeon]|nr:hypothetical protein [Acidilobales archaeon]
MGLNLITYLVKVLGKHTLIYVSVIIVLTSSFTYFVSSLTNSSYEVMLHGLSPEGINTLVIYSGSASTPFTGLIDYRLKDKLINVSGVKITWAEILTPVLVNGNHLVILRGVETEGLKYLNININSSDYFAVLAGCRLVKDYGLSVGDKVIIYSLFSNVPIELRIVGVVCKDPYSNELVTTLDVARYVRGVPASEVTLIRVIYDPKELNTDMLMKLLNIEKPPTKPAPLPTYLLEHAAIVLTKAKGGAYVATPQELTDIYLNRFGLSRDMFFISSILIVALLSYIMYVCGSTVMALRKGELAILNSIGISTVKVKASLLTLFIPLATASILLGIYLAPFMGRLWYLTIVGYELSIKLDATLIIAQVVTQSLAFTLGILNYRVGD